MSVPSTRGCTAALRLLAAALLFGTLVPAPARGQEKVAVAFAQVPRFASEVRAVAGVAPVLSVTLRFEQDPQEPTKEDLMTTSGFFLGIVGMLAGAAVGSGVGNAHCGSSCVPRYMAGGASVGGALVIPVGVRLVNDEGKNPLVSWGASIGTGAAIWAGFHQIPGHPVALAPFVAAPVQVWLVSKLERR